MGGFLERPAPLLANTWRTPAGRLQARVKRGIIASPATPIEGQSLHVSDRYRYNPSVVGLREILRRMSDSAPVRVHTLQDPGAAKILTAAQVRFLIQISHWCWRGSIDRVKWIREVAPPPDVRRPNDWQACYRNTEASCEALRNVGHDLSNVIDWDKFTQRPAAVATRLSNVRMFPVKLEALHPGRLVRIQRIRESQPAIQVAMAPVDKRTIQVLSC